MPNPGPSKEVIVNDCPACGGPLVVLGQLGNTEHYRCQACGLESHAPIEVERERPEFPIYVGWDGREHGEF